MKVNQLFKEESSLVYDLLKQLLARNAQVYYQRPIYRLSNENGQFEYLFVRDIRADAETAERDIAITLECVRKLHSVILTLQQGENAFLELDEKYAIVKRRDVGGNMSYVLYYVEHPEPKDGFVPASGPYFS